MDGLCGRDGGDLSKSLNHVGRCVSRFEELTDIVDHIITPLGPSPRYKELHESRWDSSEKAAQ